MYLWDGMTVSAGYPVDDMIYYVHIVDGFGRLRDVFAFIPLTTSSTDFVGATVKKVSVSLQSESVSLVPLRYEPNTI